MIPLPNRMIQMLHRCEPESPEAYFLTGQEARYLEPRSMNLYLKRTAAKLNLPAVHSISYDIPLPRAALKKTLISKH